MGYAMANADASIRITGDHGELSFRLLDISVQSDGFIGSSVIIAHRPGISDELVYHKMLAREFSLSRSVVVFPLPQPCLFPFEPQPGVLNFGVDAWKYCLKPGNIFRLHLQSETQSIKNLIKLRRAILPRKPDETFPIIFVIDTLQKIPATLEKELLILLREAPLNHLSIWLHCPLNSVSSDLFSVVGNAAVIWPSEKEVRLLKENLSVDTYQDEVGKSHSRGMLFVSNIITPAGKGWQYSELEYVDFLR